MPRKFEVLGPSETPEQGLFVLSTPSERGEKVIGLGFLVSPEGIVATCAHVYVYVDPPSESIVVRGFWRELPIMVDAYLLERGWRGPSREEWAEHAWHGTGLWMEFCDRRPETFQQDHALLRIEPASARWDLTRGPAPIGKASDRLLEQARVLQLAVPGYAPGMAERLLAWKVDTEEGAVLGVQGQAAFAGFDRMHHAVRLRTTELGKGFSGSPLWDPARRRVVGMVRRGIPSLPGIELATDAREISSLAGVRIALDEQAESFVMAAAQSAEVRAPLRHFPLLQAHLPAELLDLRVKRATGVDPLAPDEHAPDEHNGVDAVVASIKDENIAVTILRAPAGAGKTTLLHQVAMHLLESVECYDGLQLVPFQLSAADIKTAGFSLVDAMKRASTALGFNVSEGATIDWINTNGLCVVFLVDGIDEISESERSALAGNLGAGALGLQQRHHRVVLATRPLEDKDSAFERLGQRRCILDILPLDKDDIDRYVRAAFSSSDQVDKVKQAVEHMEWERAGPLPLQLAMVVNAVELNEELGQRPVDLMSRMVDHLVKLGSTAPEAPTITAKSKAEAGADFADHRALVSALERIALHYLEGCLTRGAVAEVLSTDSRGIPGFATPIDALSFVERHERLRSAVVSFVPIAGTKDADIVWPHRSVAEVLAARAVASNRLAFDVGEPVVDLTATARRHGQFFGILLLAALEKTSDGRRITDRFLRRCIQNGAAERASTLLAMRAFGAGINVSDELRKRLLKTMIALLLLPPNVRVGRISCAEVFTLNDVNLLELAKRPALRPLLIEQLAERWNVRIRPRGAANAIVRVSEREAMLLDRLDLWWEFDVRLQGPRGCVSDPGWQGALRAPTLGPGRAFAASADSAILLAEAFDRLAREGSAFMGDFAQFARASQEIDPSLILRNYMQSRSLSRKSGHGAH